MRRSWSSRNLSARQALSIAGEWWEHARFAQYPLLGLGDIWLVIGGRGAGKTRLGAEWVNAMVRGWRPFTETKHGNIALIGETLGDVREVMIEGPSGIMAVSRHDRPRYEPSRRRLVWDSGAVAQVFSSEDPESLRGPQFDAAWCDELAKWRQADAAFDMLQFGMRVGARPVQIVTTTPKPTPLLRRLVADEAVTVTRMRTGDNVGNLPAAFLRAVEKRYGGTRLGRQELDGELIEDREDALWSRAGLEAAVRPPGDLQRIVVAIDPPATSRKTSDACGIVVAGRDAAGDAHVLHDGTVRAVRPRAWAAAAVELYRRFEADCIVAEVNQGGEMVTAVIATVDAAVPVRSVRASRGKWLRAEPVAALYQQGRVHHAARFPELEDEMCDFGPDGLSHGRSPDRLDALVWAVSELLLGRGGEPRIRDFGG